MFYVLFALTIIIAVLFGIILTLKVDRSTQDNTPDRI
jgi:hypothetical protein